MVDQIKVGDLLIQSDGENIDDLLIVKSMNDNHLTLHFLQTNKAELQNSEQTLFYKPEWSFDKFADLHEAEPGYHAFGDDGDIYREVSGTLRFYRA